MRSTLSARIGAGVALGFALLSATACGDSGGNPVSGGLAAGDTAPPPPGAAGSPGSGKAGAPSPKEAVQALIDGVKSGDDSKIKAATCANWPSLTSKKEFDLNRELDPPAQKAFLSGVPGEPKQAGDKWEVPVSMPGDSPITVKVTKDGTGYLACGINMAGGPAGG